MPFLRVVWEDFAHDSFRHQLARSGITLVSTVMAVLMERFTVHLFIATLVDLFGFAFWIEWLMFCVAVAVILLAWLLQLWRQWQPLPSSDML